MTAPTPDASPSGIGLVLPLVPGGREAPAWWGEIAPFCAEVEAAGADALWMLDHVAWRSASFDCMTAAALAVAGTHRATVGTAVLQLPLRPPALVAKAAASLQIGSAGRFVLGLGTGLHRGEFELLGADYPGRRRALVDGIHRLRALWEPTSGPYVQLPSPPPIPVWIGGTSDHLLAVTAVHGNGWIPIQLDVPAFRERSAVLDELCASADRPEGAITRAPLLFIAVGGSPSTLERGAAWFGSMYGVDPRRVRRHIVAGSPNAIAERVSEYLVAGAQHVALLIAADDPRDDFARVAAAVG